MPRTGYIYIDSATTRTTTWRTLRITIYNIFVDLNRVSYYPDSTTYPLTRLLTQSPTPCLHYHPLPPLSFLFPTPFFCIYRGLKTTFNRQSPHSFLTIGARTTDQQYYIRLHLHGIIFRLTRCIQTPISRPILGS